MTVIPIVICALGIVTTGLVQTLKCFKIRKRLATIQSTALFTSARI